MDGDTQALWKRIEQFRLDVEDVTLPFTARLARDNGWSRVFARRVCDEYKRFMFLTVVADHVVTPSDAVDQAWHLHLTYTRSYWIEFCDGVLGRKVHHDPTRGVEEQHQFVDLYERTLQTYRRVFGHAPPADIWPESHVRFGEDLHARWVHRSRYWIVPKPRLPALRHRLPWSRVLAGGLVVPPVVAAASPFDLAGRAFLFLYGVLLVVGLLLALMLRRTLAEPPPTVPTDQLSPTEVAFLAGGMQQALHAALSELVHSKAVSLVETKRRTFGFLPRESEYRVFAGRSTGDSRDPLHRAVLGAASLPEGATAKDLRKAAAGVIPQIRRDLAEQGLVGPSQWSTASNYAPALVMLAVALVGTAKIFIGISRDGPVAFLVVATVAAGIVAVLFMLRSRVTRHGKQIVGALKVQHTSLATAARDEGSTLSPAELSLAVALFGASVLGGGPLADFRRALETFHYTSSGAAYGGGGGCGGAGCGGGGCGGGCGGCGGCGG